MIKQIRGFSKTTKHFIDFLDFLFKFEDTFRHLMSCAGMTEEKRLAMGMREEMVQAGPWRMCLDGVMVN